jgi:hypothetical protein
MFGCIFPIGDWHSVLNQRLPPACRILTIEMNHYFDIVEGSMKKRQWTCRRQPVEQMEALRRWDRAYQWHLAMDRSSPRGANQTGGIR